ncbi:MAG: putative aminopeptidase [Acidobacteria bacterium]|nr:putative aminopeptidase [Acidobacteriota bacterium]
MFGRRSCSWALALLLLAAAIGFQARAGAQQDDPVVAKIIALGKSDNRVMTWNDYASNRFGGRETGTNAYRDATEWAVWQFRQWGLEAELDEVGELPVGFNRGPWFGRMRSPVEKALRFGTPSFTAGTKGIQRGGVIVLKADPFSVPGRATGGAPVSKENYEKKRAAVEAALAEIAANKAAFAGKWVLIPGASTGFARDGRRGTKLPDGSPEYTDAELIPPLTRALAEAGALGTIQSAKPTAPAQDGFLPPIAILDGFVASWDTLPVLPDIKLLDSQYSEIKELAEKGEPVDLEFDIRNWFRMGPVKYHNVVATLRGSTYPDEYVVIGGHFDAFSGATGGVDDGSGFSPNMEAMRLLAKAGARPRRTIVAVLFAAEESGLLGSQAWLRNRPGIESKIVLMINRDGSPSAITGATVPPAWYPDFERITAPLAALNPKWPFKLARNEYPAPQPTTPGGSDHSSFQMKGVPTLSVQTTSARPGANGEKDANFSYTYVWHTTNDLYDQLVPYAEYQQHSALATAVLAYGAANLDKPLPREGVYLPDGLYADISVGAADAPKRVMASIDFVNAPLHAAAFVRLFEGNKPGSAAQPARPPAAALAMMGQGRPPEAPPIGQILDVKGVVTGIVTSETAKAMAVKSLPKRANRALKQDGPGLLALAGPATFSLAAGKKGSGVAIGKVIAGLSAVPQIGKGDPIRSVRILRVGQAARDFKTDDEGFKALLGR